MPSSNSSPCRYVRFIFQLAAAICFLIERLILLAIKFIQQLNFVSKFPEALILRLVKNMFQSLYFSVGERLIFQLFPVADVPQGFFELIFCPTILSPTKRWNIAGGQPFSENITTDTYYCSGIKRSVDGSPGIVAYQESALEPGPDELAGGRIPYIHFSRIVLQVGIGSTCPKVAPLSDHRIPQIAVMAFIGISEDHRVLDLSPYGAIRADGGCAIDPCPHFYDGPFAEGKRAPDHGTFHDLCVAANIDRACRGVEDRI